jgi:F-type H+-transporting ATPase subunit a
MGLEFLARVRQTSLLAGLVAVLATASFGSIPLGLGVAGGAAWSLVNLRLLEYVVVGLTAPDRRKRVAFRRLAVGFGASLVMFALGAVLLTQLSPLALVAGFVVPFGVMALKAGSLMLLGSRFWRRFTASRWQAAAVVTLVTVGVWFAANGLRDSVPAIAEPATPETHAPTTAPDPHATPADDAHGPKAGAAHDEGGHGEAKGPKLFPNILGIIIGNNHDAPWAGFLHHFEYIIFAMFVALVISLLAITAARNPKMIPGPLQNLFEAGVEAAYGFFVGILGPKYGPRLVPFLGTLFIYIWAMNFVGTIPLMHSPTSNLNITVAMALTVFVYVQFVAFKELGFMGWLDHMAGSPRDGIGWALVPLMLPVHLIGELAKPISLSCRLFGNIFGEDMLLVGFATLGITALSALHVPFGLPLQLPFMFLGVLITQPVQALVFTMLSTVYFLLVLPHDDHGHGHESAEHHPAH